MRGSSSHRGDDGLSLGSFVALGLPDGMLGTAWPSMRHSFHSSIGDLGLILLVATAGAALVSVMVGRLIRRVGVPGLLVVGCGCGAAGAVGFAAAPGLGTVLGVAVLAGAASGMLDGGLNTAVGMSGRTRMLNLLHGAYGIGTAIGPLLVTAAILAVSWRLAYGVLVAVDVVVAVLWLSRHRGRTGDPPSGVASPPSSPSPRSPSVRVAPVGPTPTPGRGAVAAGIVVFFVYTGLEVGAGQWEATFCRGHLGLSAGLAGIAAFGYWAALTAVRLALAIPRRPVPGRLVIWSGSGAAVLAAGLIWWGPDTPATVIGFVLLGAALAGVFPALVSLTPYRLGSERAQHAIAWQVGAASAGGAGVSALIGLLIGSNGLAVLGPALTALAALLLAGQLVLDRVAPPSPPA